MTIDRRKFIDFVQKLSDQQWDDFCNAYGFAGSGGAPAEDELMGDPIEPDPSVKHVFKVAADSAERSQRGFRRRWGSRVADMPSTPESHGGR